MLNIMIKPDDPRKLAEDLLDRSTCSVQVAAVLADRYGIYSWGFNHVGFDGFGAHAEIEAIRRANKNRLDGSFLYVAGRRRKSGNSVLSKPCELCYPVIRAWGIRTVWFRDSDEQWMKQVL